ncbi:MAG: hypothetical protein JWL63_2361 [Rhodocyclales bacterium]|nr:hypothetical protein [Rhodocyclales bacterium]
MWLKTLQQGNQVRFQLELQRGGPSYNSGWIEGEFKLIGSSGKFSGGIDGTEKPCEITFRFYRRHVEIGQPGVAPSCNFGFNVYAVGKLTQKSKNNPDFSESDPRFGK